MAEKEERQKRLLIKEYDLVCDLADCKYCEEKDWCSEKDGITRQKAIEKMAKALFNFQYDGGLSFEYAYDGAKKEFRLFAKAALNALLEEK